MQEIKLTSYKLYLFGHIFSVRAKKARTEQSTLNFFYSVHIETTNKPSKEAAAKMLFCSVHVIDANCFNKCFLFHVITRRHYFL